MEADRWPGPGIAARKASRYDPRLAALYAGATAEDVASKLRMKKAVVTFSAHPFTGGLHEIYDGVSLDDRSARELAMNLEWSLRESLRRSSRRG